MVGPRLPTSPASVLTFTGCEADAQPSAGDVYVWRVALDGVMGRGQLWELLDPVETARARGYRFPLDRERFVACRGLLRTVLGRYLHRPPAEVRFHYGRWGKPEIEGEQGPDGLRFNVSDSHELALFAIALGWDVGVDLERIRTGVAIEQIADRHFTPGEQRLLASLGPEPRLEAFFSCWVRKEAYAKARGGGLSLPFEEFDVMSPGPPTVVPTGGDARELSRWSLHELDAGPEYAAALVVEGRQAPPRQTWRPTPLP